jgi:hypothetical protein
MVRKIFQRPGNNTGLHDLIERRAPSAMLSSGDLTALKKLTIGPGNWRAYSFHRALRPLDRGSAGSPWRALGSFVLVAVALRIGFRPVGDNAPIVSAAAVDDHTWSYEMRHRGPITPLFLSSRSIVEINSPLELSWFLAASWRCCGNSLSL